MSHTSKEKKNSKDLQNFPTPVSFTTSKKLIEYCEVGFSESTALGGETCYAFSTDAFPGVEWALSHGIQRRIPQN